LRIMIPEITRKLPVVDLKAQYSGLREEILAAVSGVLDNAHFILGPNVAGLEREIAQFCQSPYAVGVASGTDALILALRAAGIQEGDEVVVPAFSFVATADAVSILGGTPVFADVDPSTLNIDVNHASSLITDRTRAIVPVHLYGQPADMDALLKLAERHSLVVVEDCAQALGASWRQKPVGSLGDYGCISFFPTKNLGAYGDGGMITARNQRSAARLKKLRVHGSEKKYCHDEQGMNSRLDELQAAILRVKLPHLERWNVERRRVADLYRQALAPVDGIALPWEGPEGYHVYHQFTIRHERRDAIQAALRESGIESVVYYPIPLHLQPMYSHLGYRTGQLPVAEAAAAEVLSLPIFPEMGEEDVAYVAEQMERAISVSLRRSA
jgi:dTDP-4-amino-4,6-dideoxygalactose transaminase